VLHTACWKHRTLKFAICALSHNFVGLYLHNYGMYRQSEKNLLNSNILDVNLLHMSSQYGELRPINGWDRLASLELPANFSGFCTCFITAPISLKGGQPKFARCLAISCAGTPYIHFRGLLPPNRIFPGAKSTSHPSLAVFYIVSITAWHSSSGHQPNFEAWYFHAAGWVAMLFDIGRLNCLVCTVVQQLTRFQVM